QFISCRGDDGAGSDRTACALPSIPNTRKREWRSVFHLKVIRLRDPAVPLPLVKPICKDQASSSLKRVIEARFLFDRLDARVDDSLGLFAPRRNQSPLQKRGLTVFAVLLDGQHILSRCDVVARYEIFRTKIVDMREFYSPRIPECKSATHLSFVYHQTV